MNEIEETYRQMSFQEIVKELDDLNYGIYITQKDIKNKTDYKRSVSTITSAAGSIPEPFKTEIIELAEKGLSKLLENRLEDLEYRRSIVMSFLGIPKEKLADNKNHAPENLWLTNNI